MNEIKDKPIVFNGTNVRALLENRKTQTRRVIKPQPSEPEMLLSKLLSTTGTSQHIGKYRWVKMNKNQSEIIKEDKKFFNLPYVLGQKLWVKETQWRNGGYVATDKPTIENDGKIPSIFMRRDQSRILLQIKELRVERVQEITDDDALAEGIEEYHGIVGVSGAGGSHSEINGARYDSGTGEFEHEYPTDAFEELWNSIHKNTEFSWACDPFILAITFDILEKG